MRLNRHPQASVRAGALVVALLAAPGLAVADDAADMESARALFVEGAKLANQGRWEGALVLYRRSFELKPAPITRYSLGVAQQETGHIADALASFRAFLEEPRMPATAQYAEAARAAISTLEKRVGAVTILVEPQAMGGLVLAIDGRSVPAVGGRAHEIEPGDHVVVARAPDFREAKVPFSVAAGRKVTVAITLAPAASRTLPIVLMSVGGGLLTGGVVLGLLGVTEAGRAPTQGSAEARAARTKAIAGDVMGGVGIAAVGVGLVWLLTQGRSSAPSASGATVSANGGALGLAMSF